MIGYKKCVVRKSFTEKDIFVLVELEIPDDAVYQMPIVCHDPNSILAKWYNTWCSGSDWNTNTEKKCRADKAIVLKIHGGFDKVTSLHDETYEYVVGQEMRPREPYDTGAWACGNGIHFFLDKNTAIDYALGGVWKYIEDENGSILERQETSVAIVDRDQVVADAE